jgi:hypothetical protein
MEATKMHKFKKTIAIVAVIFSLVSVTSVFASTYGSGTYGSNTYSTTSALTYTMTGSAGGPNNTVSSNFTVTPAYAYTGTFTLSDAGAGGTFSPSTLTFSTSATPQTFTYRPIVSGPINITASANPALSDASTAITYTSETVPGIPTGVTAAGGNASAVISFTAPSNGGATITSYTVTSTPGGIITTGSSSPIIVSGLTNGTSYTFTVSATNSVGTGTASAASNAVIPAVPAIVSGGGGGGLSGGQSLPCQNGVLYNLSTGAACPDVSVEQTITNPATDPFTKNLSYGTTDPQVKLLQQYLNKHGFIVAKSGVGSAGKEANHFGLATKNALIKFQKAHSIKPATGSFGPLTREYVRLHY